MSPAILDSFTRCRVRDFDDGAVADPGLPTAMALAPDVPPTGRSSVIAPKDSMDESEVVSIQRAAYACGAALPAAVCAGRSTCMPLRCNVGSDCNPDGGRALQTRDPLAYRFD